MDFFKIAEAGETISNEEIARVLEQALADWEVRKGAVRNALIIPPVLIFAYEATEAYWFILLTVTAGEVLSCAAVGYPLMFLLRRYKLFSFELPKKKR